MGQKMNNISDSYYDEDGVHEECGVFGVYDLDGGPRAGRLVGRDGQHDVRRELPDGGRDERVLRGCVRDGVIPQKNKQAASESIGGSFFVAFSFSFSAQCREFRPSRNFSSMSWLSLTFPLDKPPIIL